MLRLNATPPPAREWNRGPALPALGISFGLHVMALAGLVLFRAVTPPEPYAVIAVELVQAGDAGGSPGEYAGEQLPLSKSMDSARVEVAESTPDPGQLAGSRDRDDRLDVFEASRKNSGSSVEQMTKPTRISEHAPTPGNTSDRRESVPPTPIKQPPPIESAAVPEATAETMLMVPPSTRRKPQAPDPSTRPKPSKPRIEVKPTTIKDESLQSVDQESAREVVQSDAERATVRTQQIVTLNQEKHRVMAALPATAGGGGLADSLGDTPGTLPRYTGGGLSNAPPRYPYLARRRGQEGRVVLRVQVSATGDPSSVRVRQSSGYRQLDDATVKAVKTWRFVPASRGGFPVAGAVDVPVSFMLTD